MNSAGFVPGPYVGLSAPSGSMQDDADGFVEGGSASLDNAMSWGALYGIGVLLDLHAPNGSQNGYDHSAPVRQNAR